MSQRMLLPFLSLLTFCLPVRADYVDHPEGREFLRTMVEEHGFPAGEVRAWLQQAERKQSILDAISRPAEAKPWYEYRPIFVNRARIEAGAVYWDKHEEVLGEIERRMGIDPRIIVAIVGVETRYGRHAGGYRVLDALATLGFDYPPRADFFRKELEQFFLLSREEDIKVTDAKGSYAGAMGHGQFIPSSYRRYAIDFDNDGERNLWDSTYDILGSVGNYLKVHGWRHEAPIAIPATVRGEGHASLLERGSKPSIPAGELSKYGVSVDRELAPDTRVALLSLEKDDGEQYWVTFNNFYVITRYNRSPLYAMAVFQLAEAIAEERREGLYSE